MTDPQLVPHALRAPHFEQYFGAWAMKEDTFRAAFDRVARMDLTLHVTEQNARAAARSAEGDDSQAGPRVSYPVTESGVAVVQLSGTLMKHVGSLQEGTSTVLARRQLRAATNNPAIAGILVLIDSPGGTVAGTFELAEDVAAAAAKKPTHAYIQDLGASAAYWAASQAAVISTNVMGIVGSIGTFMPVYDFSGWAAKEGIRVEIVREGEFKGAGVPGTKVTDEQIAEWQRTVTALNAQFVAGVSKGRKVSAARAKELNDGRVYVGNAAKAQGLVDHVETFEQAVKRLEAASSPSRKPAASRGAKAEEDLTTVAEDRSQPNNEDAGGTSAGATQPTAEDAGTPAGAAADRKEEAAMSQTQTAPAATTAGANSTEQQPPKAATMAELKAACPGATSDFLVEQSEKNATVAQAKDAYLAFQSQEITRLRAELQAAGESKAAADGKPTEPKAAEAKKGAGVAPVADRAAEQKAAADEAGSDAVAVFDQRVKALTDTGMSRTKAAAKVLADDEQLRADYVAAKSAK